MRKRAIFFSALTCGAATVLCGAGAVVAQDAAMSFFVTGSRPGGNADLGGLVGADAICQAMATEAGAGDLVWRAYLSTQATADAPAVNARDRIGTGPWFNANGELIAESVAHLHSDDNHIDRNTAVNQNGTPFNQHDILTGSQPDGTAYPAGDDFTCGNWTSGGEGSAQVGHHNRRGLNLPDVDPTSWNSSHLSAGCGRSDLESTGGEGRFYCFALNPEMATAVRESFEAGQPEAPALGANYPNPFNSGTVVRFELAASGPVSLAVFNLQGQKVATLASGVRAAGRYSISWDGRDDAGRALATGAYLYRLEAGGRVEARKMLLVR